MHFVADKMSRRLSGLGIYSYFQDRAFTAVKVVPEANLTISDCVNFLRPGRSHLNETVCQVSSPESPEVVNTRYT